MGALLILAAAVGGCRSPAAKINRFADQHSFDREIVTGNPFRHVVMRNALPLLHSTLHVYIEGDGTPFVNLWTVAADPTPLRAVMLHLMALDSQRTVYVGRPCYLGLRTDSSCNASYWTLRRFSAEVVASLATVIRSEMRHAGASSVQLFAHSGGGALAVLLTRELSGVSALVTIGGNLDTDAWVRLHGYTPLTGSLNPSGVTLPPGLARRANHYVGSDDTAVPAFLIRQAAQRIGGEVHEVQGYGHQCCWEKLWPAILAHAARD